MTPEASKALGALAAGAILALGLSGAGAAAERRQKDPVERLEEKMEERFEKIEKQLRQTRQIITQSRDTGQPVQVRIVTEPDPVVESLSRRVDDMEQASRTRNEQIDTMSFDIQEARKEAADARAELKAAMERLTKVEARLRALDDGIAASIAEAGGLQDVPTVPPPGGAPASGRAEGDPEAAFRQAKQLLLEGQYAAASGAFQNFVDTYGEDANAPEARYWLAETLYIRGMYADAAAAYIGAIRGWPKTNWAPDAVVKLARTLVALDKRPDACRTLDEFTKRYPQAPAPVKGRASDVRAAAACA